MRLETLVRAHWCAYLEWGDLVMSQGRGWVRRSAAAEAKHGKAQRERPREEAARLRRISKRARQSAKFLRAAVKKAMEEQ